MKPNLHWRDSPRHWDPKGCEGNEIMGDEVKDELAHQAPLHTDGKT